MGGGGGGGVDDYIWGLRHIIVLLLRGIYGNGVGIFLLDKPRTELT